MTPPPATLTDPAPEDWRRTDPRGILARALVYLQKGFFGILAALVGARSIGDGDVRVIAGIAALIVAINAICAFVTWRHHRYWIGPDDIRVEHGLIGRTARSIPYDRIQDVSLAEAPIPRLMGLVEVRFETGAGGKDEAVLAYVTRAQGRLLRETVRRQIDAAPAPMPAPAQDEPALLAAVPQGEEPARTLFVLTPRRLLLFGLFEFSLIVFVVLFGAADQLQPFLPFDIWNPDEWRTRGSLPLGVLLGLGLALQVAGAVLALLTILALGVLTGLVRTALRDWGFRLEQTPRGLRRRRGLLTRTDVLMPLHRVQALRLTTRFLRHRFGWHALEAISLAQDEKDACHTIIPFGQMAEIAPLAALAGLPLPGDTVAWHRSSARHRRDRALLAWARMAAVAAGLFVLAAVVPPMMPGEPPEIAVALSVAGFVMLGVGALLAVRQLFLSRFSRHAVTAQLLYAQEGWLRRAMTIAALVKLQSVELVQGPLGHRGGYADLHLGLAGGTLTIRGVPLTRARAIRERALADMAATDFSRLPGSGS